MAAIGDHVRRPFPDENLHRRHRRPMLVADRYFHLEDISRGSYGVVRKALDNKTREVVAIKEEFDGLSQSTAREIGILRSLPRHPSIVEFRNVFVGGGGGREKRVFVVMEYAETDLDRLMAKSKQRPAFTAGGVKRAMRQILDGVAFLHGHGIMHRDIKPSNILVTNEAALKVKLCDFGLSRQIRSESGAYTPGMVTLCYRAPEMLLGSDVYSPAIDVWSVGCVMAQMVLGCVLFPGNSELQQLGYIMLVMGTPGMLRAAFDGAALHITASGIDLLERLLAYDPSKRINARDALNHAWFKEAS